MPAQAPKIGLLLNQEEGPGIPTPRWRGIRDIARRAEAAGVASLWLVDHFLWRRDPWGREDLITASEPDGPFGVWESWTTLAALADATTRIEIGTQVTCTGYRNPALLAKMADTVDEISGGRLVLGLGAGDAPDEHRTFGFPFERRFARFEEALEIIVPLLRTGIVDHEGEYASARHCVLRPRGPRPLGPPILIGSLANGPRVLGLVARFADVWNAWLTTQEPMDAIPRLVEAVDAACLAQGRDPETLRRSVTVAIAFDGPMMRRNGILTGSEVEIAGRLEAIARAGIDEIDVVLFPTTRQTVARLGRIIDALPGREP